MTVKKAPKETQLESSVANDWLDDSAVQVTFAALVGCSPDAIGRYIEIGAMTRGATYRQWIREYCDRLRQSAAGRGGDEAGNLTEARTKNELAKAALAEIQYMEKTGVLIPADAAEAALIEWADATSREISNMAERINHDLESETSKQFNDKVIEIANDTARRISEHAEKLAAGIGGGKQDISACATSGEDWLDGCFGGIYRQTD